MLAPDLRARAERHHARLVADLLADTGDHCHWTGELSTSALSTAVATIALGEIDRQQGRNDHQALVDAGLRWLADHANPDGGWGDTVRSRSNLSTTALAWAAFGAAAADPRFPEVVRNADRWIRAAIGPDADLVAAIENRYGDDRTFSIPIVLTLAASGRLGPAGWRRVRALPFELAALPRSWFGALQLPVVSYALPALIALGQAIHAHHPSANPLARLLRIATRRPTLDRLVGLQPPNGGFLEATPLTAFVTLSLASMGLVDHVVLQRGAAFLRASLRPDGSWPIDTNLATWTTTLSLKALGHTPDALPPERRAPLRTWLLDQQFRTVHPYTGAAPGGWAWTDLPGGVPDADDTAGALLALAVLDQVPDAATMSAAAHGVAWLLGLQNRDGGIPTFCRGWGRLPFDRSAPDLTAHALRAWHAWRPHLPAPLQSGVDTARLRALNYLVRSQRPDGAWVPLWFGNEHAPDDENPVHGTAHVLGALAELGPTNTPIRTAMERGFAFLRSAQHPNGGWGGAASAPESVEETALALGALAAFASEHAALPPVLVRGVTRLLDLLDQRGCAVAAPIGLYFARLWYFERLYPLIHATDGLGRILRFTADPGPRTTGP